MNPTDKTSRRITILLKAYAGLKACASIDTIVDIAMGDAFNETRERVVYKVLDSFYTAMQYVNPER